MSSLDRPTSARNSGNRGSASWASKAFANQRKSQSQRRPQSAGRTRGSAEVHDDRSECKQTALELMEEENWPKCGPPRSGARRVRPASEDTPFKLFYDRRDIPVTVEHMVNRKLLWQVQDVSRLDYTHYLPLFFHGLRNKTEPYQFLAYEGVMDMLEEAGDRVLICVPELVQPLKLALNTRDPKILRRIMKVLTRMVTMCDMVGEAMVPYFRQLLPVLNIFKDDKEVFGKRNETCLGELVYETLTTFETYGGPDAFVNIKYMIPTYESCLS